ncbi:MAG: histidine phosphatase family protein [Nanoarchaeota archaeon]
MPNKTIFSLRKHERRERDVTGKKLVHLTGEAYERAKFYGSLIEADRVCGYSSRSTRTVETLRGILEGAGIENPEAVMQQTDLLNEIDFRPNPEYRRELDQFLEYDDRINYLLQKPDRTGKIETMQQLGQKVMRHIGQVYREVKGENGVCYVENVLHGASVEGALILLVDPTLKDIKYLHGGCRDGEGFRLEVEDGDCQVFFKGDGCNLRGLFK